MYLAIVRDWTLSFGTTRKKFGIEPFVSALPIAEPEMNGSRSAFMKTGATASTSRLRAGPTTARMSGFAWNVVATVGGPRRIEPRVAFDELDRAAAELPDRVSREAELLLADERRITRDRAHEADSRARRTTALGAAGRVATASDADDERHERSAAMTPACSCESSSYAREAGSPDG